MAKFVSKSQAPADFKQSVYTKKEKVMIKLEIVAIVLNFLSVLLMSYAIFRGLK